MNETTAFVKARDKMLLKCSVEELRKFVKNNGKYYDTEFITAVLFAKDEFLEMVLHKMIVNCTSLPFDFRQKSADWLLDRGLHLEIWSVDDET